MKETEGQAMEDNIQISVFYLDALNTYPKQNINYCKNKFETEHPGPAGLCTAHACLVQFSLNNEGITFVESQ